MSGPGDMAQQVKMPDTKPDIIPKTYAMEEEKQLLQIHL